MTQTSRDYKVKRISPQIYDIISGGKKVRFVRNDNQCVQIGNYIIQNQHDGLTIYQAIPFQMIQKLDFDIQDEQATYQKPLYKLGVIDGRNIGMNKLNQFVPTYIMPLQTVPGVYGTSAYEFNQQDTMIPNQQIYTDDMIQNYFIPNQGQQQIQRTYEGTANEFIDATQNNYDEMDAGLQMIQDKIIKEDDDQYNLYNRKQF